MTARPDLRLEVGNTLWKTYPYYAPHQQKEFIREEIRKEVERQVNERLETPDASKPENPNALSVIARDAAVDIYTEWLERLDNCDNDDINLLQALLVDYGQYLLNLDREYLDGVDDTE